MNLMQIKSRNLLLNFIQNQINPIKEMYLVINYHNLNKFINQIDFFGSKMLSSLERLSHFGQANWIKMIGKEKWRILFQKPK